MKGEGSNSWIEGVVKDSEISCKYFDKKTEKLKYRAKIGIFPFYITLNKSKYEMPKILYQGVTRFTGKFYFGDD